MLRPQQSSCRRCRCGGRCRCRRSRRCRGRGRTPCIDHLEHVLACDPTAHTGAGHLCGTDRVLCQELPHNRGEDQRVCCPVAARNSRGHCVHLGAGRLGGRRGCGCRRGGRCRWRRCGCGRRRRRRCSGRSSCCRCRRGWCGRRCRRGGIHGRSLRRSVIADDGESDTDFDRLAFGDEDLGQDPGGR